MKKISIFVVFLLLILSSGIYSENSGEAKNKYWIFFDKKEEISLKKVNEDVKYSQQLLSERAIKRRQKVRSASDIINEYDLPVKKEYINYLSFLGINIINISKWFNAVSAYLDENEKEEVEKLPFVKGVRPVLEYIRKPIPSEEKEIFKTPSKYENTYDYGYSYIQNNIINVPRVHDLGIVGRNVLIGMMDTGFDKNHECLEDVKIVSEWDFVNNDGITKDESNDPKGQDKHGTLTLATIGGFYEGKLIGTAFGSNFALAKTEITTKESKIEEDNWVRGIEWLDSVGVDVVSSSLGYAYGFVDGPDYKFSDLDGKTAITTIAAEIAVKNGIVVVNSAGNERTNDKWMHIITPADGENVIAVGAIGVNGGIAYFSSPGPTADGRIKPDVVALGMDVKVPGYNVSDKIIYDGYQSVQGTSFSCPLVAGVTALMLSAHPYLTPNQIKEALIQTSDRKDNPNNDFGYGVVDAYKALLYFGTVFSNKPIVLSLENYYRIMTSVVSPNGIQENSFLLHYRYSDSYGEFETVVMKNDNNSNRYYGDVAVPSFGTPIYYYFSVTDSAGVKSLNPYNVPEEYHHYLSPFSQQLKSFTYQIFSRKFILLNWIMKFESDNLGFDVEKSTDNRNYIKIAHITGYGTTSSEKNYYFYDNQTNTGVYYYRLKKIDYGGFFEYSDPIKVTVGAPESFSISQNYPNPFNTITTIEYQIPEESSVEIKIYDVLGKEIKTLINEKKQVGFYEVAWDGKNENRISVSSGTYFLRFKAGKFSELKKITILK
jgi:subtilisin family serine protease